MFWNYVQTKSDPVDGIPGVLRNTLEVNEGGHTWLNWRLYLSELLPRLFR